MDNCQREVNFLDLVCCLIIFIIILFEVYKHRTISSYSLLLYKL